MSTNTKKTYDDEFKKQAVQLLISSGRPLTQIARELAYPSGICAIGGSASSRNWPNNLKRWKRCVCAWPNWNVKIFSYASNGTF